MNAQAEAAETQTGCEIFISYSHADRKWQYALQKTLRPLTRSRNLLLWADTELRAGSRWREEITLAISRADAAILLVSPDFLASDFIAGHELPPLLQAAKERGLLVLWLAISPSLYQATEIAEYQALNDPERPLATLPKPKAQAELVRAADTVQRLLANASRRKIEPNVDREHSILDIEFSPLAAAELKTVSASKQQILELLAGELRNHPVLTRIDYEFSPRPLQDGYFTVLTKSGAKLRVEHISRCLLSPEKMSLWSALCDGYLVCYRLPFRTDHTALVNQAEFERSRRAVAELLGTLNKYIYQMKVFSDRSVFPKLHRLKQEAENAFVGAEVAYVNYINDDGSQHLGKTALLLDTSISTVHKIILEYQCTD